MNRRSIFTIIITVLVLGNIITLYLVWRKTSVQAASGQNSPGKPPPDRRGAAVQFLIKELELDSAQQQAYRELMSEHQLEARPLVELANQKRDAFFDQVKLAGEPDSLQLKQLSRKAVDAQWQLNLLTLAHFRKVRALCRPEQQMKFDQVIHRALRMMGPPGGGGPPPGSGRPPGAGPEREGLQPGDENRPPPPGEERPPHQ